MAGGVSKCAQCEMGFEAEDAAPAVTTRTVGMITVANSSATTSVKGSSVASARREPKIWSMPRRRRNRLSQGST